MDATSATALLALLFLVLLVLFFPGLLGLVGLVPTQSSCRSCFNLGLDNRRSALPRRNSKHLSCGCAQESVWQRVKVRAHERDAALDLNITQRQLARKVHLGLAARFS